MFRAAGGWWDEPGCDWRTWQRIEAAGGRFRAVPIVTWRLRYHDSNVSWRGFDDTRPAVYEDA